MQYRAVGNRCSLDLSEWQLPISNERVLAILLEHGFKIVEINIVSLAEACIGISEYRRGVKLSQAPSIVDCSSFVKWLYGRRGIWLPRRTIQQRELGESVTLDNVVFGDLVFCAGRSNYYTDDPSQGVGHVGMVTGEKEIIHASSAGVGVIKQSLEGYLEDYAFRGVRRYLPSTHDVLILETPPEMEIETSDDFRWIVLQSL